MKVELAVCGNFVRVSTQYTSHTESVMVPIPLWNRGISELSRTGYTSMRPRLKSGKRAYRNWIASRLRAGLPFVPRAESRYR